MNCYVDIETTGLDPKSHRITRLTAIKAHRYEVVDIFDQMLNPERQVERKILAMTGLDQAVLNLMPTLDVIKPRFWAFIKGHRIIGWGNFEDRWLTHFGLAARAEDACNAVKRATKNRLVVANYRLPTVCTALKIPLRHHDSLSDALAVYHICNLTGVF